MKETTLLLELLASRICHDLISPVGAIHNGIEFLEEMGADALDDAIGLMQHSALQSTVKLKTFRLAYGAGGRDPSVSAEDVYNAIREYTALDGKITQDWDPHGSITDIDNDGFSKILMGTLLLATEVLIKGGTLSVETGDDCLARVIAKADDFILRESIIEALNGETDANDIDPRSVTAYLLGLNARDLDMNVEIEPSDSQIAFKITQ